MKTLKTKETWRIQINTIIFLVTVERLKNTYAGAPRYEFEITDITEKRDYNTTYCIRSTGDYRNPYDIARDLCKNFHN